MVVRYLGPRVAVGMRRLRTLAVMIMRSARPDAGTRVLRRVSIERLLAVARAEVIGHARVLAPPSGRGRVDLHPAHGVGHSRRSVCHHLPSFCSKSLLSPERERGTRLTIGTDSSCFPSLPGVPLP